MQPWLQQVPTPSQTLSVTKQTRERSSAPAQTKTESAWGWGSSRISVTETAKIPNSSDKVASRGDVSQRSSVLSSSPRDVLRSDQAKPNTAPTDRIGRSVSNPVTPRDVTSSVSLPPATEPVRKGGDNRTIAGKTNDVSNDRADKSQRQNRANDIAKDMRERAKEARERIERQENIDRSERTGRTRKGS